MSEMPGEALEPEDRGDPDSYAMNIDSVLNPEVSGQGPWNVPDDRPDAELGPTIDLASPAASWFSKGRSGD